MAGFACSLNASSEIDVVGTLDHGEALRWSDEWQDVDVVLVDAADEHAAGNHFPGVDVVRRIRACQGENRPIVHVVTGHFLNDGLRHRMAEAQADFFFLRSDLRTVEALQDVVLCPERYRRGVPPVADPSGRRALGITARSRVEEFVTYVEDHGLAGALDPIGPSRSDPRSRRWLRHRQEIAKAARIEPVNLSTGEAPFGNQSSPSLRQLRGIYGWAANVRPIDSALSVEE